MSDGYKFWGLKIDGEFAVARRFRKIYTPTKFDFGLGWYPGFIEYEIVEVTVSPLESNQVDAGGRPDAEVIVPDRFEERASTEFKELTWRSQ
jgi:hypothetical protein